MVTPRNWIPRQQHYSSSLRNHDLLKIMQLVIHLTSSPDLISYLNLRTVLSCLYSWRCLCFEEDRPIRHVLFVNPKVRTAINGIFSPGTFQSWSPRIRYDRYFLYMSSLLNFTSFLWRMRYSPGTSHQEKGMLQMRSNRLRACNQIFLRVNPLCLGIKTL